MSETGAVKFICEQSRVQLAPFPGFVELNACRRKLLQLRFLGVDASGIGFGNLSVRDGATNRFYITGSATGSLPLLELRHFAHVTSYDFEENCVRCQGLTVASSESLTHAAVYESDAEVCAVIHGHSIALWTKLCSQAPSTSARDEYGTPAMAHEVQRLFRETDVRAEKRFAMGGHEAGVIGFGSTLEEAFASLIRSCE